MRYRIRSALITITAAMLLGSVPALGLALTPAASSGPALGSIAAGYGHSCAVRTGGTLACWGRNGDGQSTPPAGTFTQVAAGGYHTCGLKKIGRAHV